MKVTVRLAGDGFARAEALVSDVRRRAIDNLQARSEERRGEPKPPPRPSNPAAITPSTR